MRKKIILRLVFLTAVAFSLHSCMHDDFSNPQQEQAPVSSFKVFQKDSNGKEPDYARGFAVLYWKYQEMHPKFKQAVSKNLKESKPALLFSLASEPLILDDGSRVVIYPVVAGSRITGLAAGVLNHEENYVSYQMISETTEGYENMISAFRLRFSMLPKDVLMRVGGNGSGCNDTSGCGETGSTQIETIVIRPKPRTIQWGGSGDGSEPWGNEPDGPPGGGCEGFGDCGGSTGNNPSAPEPPQNPCEKTKSILGKPNVKVKIDSLKKQSTEGGEKGVKFKTDGASSELIHGGAHEVDLGDAAGYQGGYHNHTPTGVKMFSPPDIVKLLHFSMAQTNGNIGDGYIGMIGSEACNTCIDGYRYYHYMINFSGTFQELANFLYNNNWDLKTLKVDYRDREGELAGNPLYVDQLGNNLNSQGLEKLFFDTLKNMGMEGKVNLQCIEDGIVKNVTLDSNGNTTTATPCP